MPSNGGGAATIETMLVAIPARNERSSIVRCLLSIDRAAARCRIPVHVVVAADACHDDTASVARSVAMRHTTLDVIEGAWRGAGRSRAAAVRAALRHGPVEEHTTWIANTDADCVVEPQWLQRHLGHAIEGAAAVAGVVALDPVGSPAGLVARFTADYEVAGSTHRHVHAANLGIRGDAYCRVGGWSEHAVVGEEHELWRRLTDAGYRLSQPTDLRVLTSSRISGRVPGGFATYLGRLQRRHPGRDQEAS